MVTGKDFAVGFSDNTEGGPDEIKIGRLRCEGESVEISVSCAQDGVC